MGLEKAVKACGMGCPVWQRGAGAASISVPPTDILPHIAPLLSSRTHPPLPVFFKQTLSLQPYTASFVLFPLSCHHPPTHSLSNTFFSSGFHADASPPYPVSHNIPSCPTHRHPPSPEHMQSRGISFYCPYCPRNPTHLLFIHCSNTFGVEVVLLRAATQTTQESQIFAQNCSYL